MLPLIPLACITLIVGGGAGLVWYRELGERERSQADRIANRLAWHLYRTSVENLTPAQVELVTGLVRQQLGA